MSHVPPLVRAGVAAAAGIVLAASAFATDSPGRVLVAVGQVVAMRGGHAVPLTRGSPIEVGDQISVGAASNAQIRFTDTSIVSLKPQTEFLVSQYSFNGAEDGSEKAIFSLLRGGLRTVTGLIGHLNKANYGVQTPAATIGIRGTVWGAQHCVADECKNEDGTSAKPGTYGEVKSGVIAVSNNAPEVDFGANTAFYVADRNTAPTRLLVAPGFVTAQVQTRSQTANSAEGGTGESSSASASASASAGGGGGTGGAGGGAASDQIGLAGTDDGRATPILSSTVPLGYVASNNTTTSGSPAVLQPTISGVTGFIAIYTVGANNADTVSTCNGGGGCSGNGVTSFAFNGSQLVSYSSTAGPQALTQPGTLASNTQSLTLATGGQGIVAQLVGAYAGTTTSGAAFSGPGGFIYLATNSTLVGNGVPLPSSGNFSFGYPGTFVGLAADGAGNAGTFSQLSGSFNAGTRTVTFSGIASFPSIAGYGPATFNLGGSSPINSGSDSVGGAALTASCSGSGCAQAAPNGDWNANFLRTSSAMPLMIISGAMVSATRNAGAGNAVVFGGALKCLSGGCS